MVRREVAHARDVFAGLRMTCGLALSLSLVGCQPLVFVRTSVHGRADPNALHFEAIGSPSGPKGIELESAGDGALVVRLSMRPTNRVRIVVWADVDGDGEESLGDLIGGHREPQTVERFSFSDTTELPDIVLEPWTPDVARGYRKQRSRTLRLR